MIMSKRLEHQFFEKYSVGGVIYRGSKYLLQHRDTNIGIESPDFWGLFGGLIEEGESAEEALLRELYEELSFNPSKFERIGEIIYRPNKNTKLYRKKIFYGIKINKEKTREFILNEGQQFQLFSIKKILKIEKLIKWDVYGIFLQHHRNKK